VRYLTNASSGRMGRALAEAALVLGHQVVIVSGPVEVQYPADARVRWVATTDEMLAACREEFPHCDGLIGAAAPCDYRPQRVESHKIAKTGQPLLLRLIETPDVVATLSAEKQPSQWVVGFALETEDPRFRALTKLTKKRCDLMVLNGPQAMDALDNRVEILSPAGDVLATLSGSKEEVAQGIFRVLHQELLSG
jgi:phosphopantothenoylcysteine decarboxylase/phosphopantothenate--cysteine ligase